MHQPHINEVLISKMEVILSNKGGQKLCNEGYMYTKKRKSNTSIFWSCVHVKSGCRGSAKTDVEITQFEQLSEHNHLPSEVKVKVAKAKATMKQSATQSDEKSSVVYARVLQDLDENTMANLPSAESCKRTIRNQRNPEYPRVPDNIRDIDVDGEWAETSNGERFLFYDNGGESESRIIAFATDRQLELLANSETWMVDGNYAMCPVGFRQLFVFMVPLGTGAVPVAYALLEHKRQSTYEELFQAVVEKCIMIGVHPDPRTVVVDYEVGLRGALRNVLADDLQIQGCFYHLTQSTWRKVQELNLVDLYKTNDEFKHTCGMLDGLAFLPVEDVAAGFQHVADNAPDEAEELVSYFNTTYVNGSYRNVQRNGNVILRRIPPRYQPEEWNVHDATVNNEQRTNNQCEGWNNKFTHLVGHQHPHIWKLIKFLRLEERCAATSIAQYNVGNLRPRKKRRIYVNLQVRLHTLCMEYNTGVRALPSFLSAVGRTIRFMD